jgi:hypothetical protein
LSYSYILFYVIILRLEIFYYKYLTLFFAFLVVITFLVLQIEEHRPNFFPEFPVQAGSLLKQLKYYPRIQLDSPGLGSFTKKN